MQEHPVAPPRFEVLAKRVEPIYQLIQKGSANTSRTSTPPTLTVIHKTPIMKMVRLDRFTMA